jgi:ornithine cyclodeaminase/alanine dehydrogenase-like protein (mu-crystallin family)
MFPMKILILSGAEVHRLLPIAECIPVMESALADLARGEAFNPLRNVLRPPGAKGFFGLMPAWRGGERSGFGLKEVCVFPGNPVIGLDTHLGAFLLHSAHTGELQGVLNASAITAIRTAAVTAVATKLLARSDARTVAVIGAGVQARAHIEAMMAARPVTRVCIASRRAAEARALAEMNPLCEAVETVEEAVRGADIIVTATSSAEPVLRREWIGDGTHINLVGSSIATAREADSATMAAGSLFVDRRESTVNESGDYLMAVREGAIAPESIRAEIGEILIGKAAGRESEAEITIFKSLGLAIEDLAAAQYLYDKATRLQQGTWIDFD